MSTAPTDDPERTLLLFCPEQGGWQTGVFFEGRWLDFATLTVELEPAHFTDVPPDPDSKLLREKSHRPDHRSRNALGFQALGRTRRGAPGAARPAGRDKFCAGR